MREPDLRGPYGRGWNLMETARRMPDHAAALRAWLIHRPGAHPFWSWYVLSVVHLRDIEGLPPAHKQFAEATHELVIFAISPEAHPNPDPDEAAEGFTSLTPIDVCQQFVVGTDEEAGVVGDLAFKDILLYGASPDQDFRRYWQAAIDGAAQAFGGYAPLGQ